MAAVTTAFLLLDQNTFDQFRFWQVGALAGRDLSIAAQVAPFLIIGTVFALCLGPLLNTLSLGEDVARGLGANVVLGRVLSAGAGGPALRRRDGGLRADRLRRPDHSARGPRCSSGRTTAGPCPYSLLLAPILLLAADIIGRVIARPGEVQVAIVTAVIGAPVFIALVRQRKLAEL